MRGPAWLTDVAATPGEVVAVLPGDEIVAHPDSVMNRGFDVQAPPEVVWPWLVQLGKGRAGWYLPRGTERFIPPSRRAARQVDQRWQGLSGGDVVPDYGGADATFEAVTIEAPRTIVYRSTRGRVHLTWVIVLGATTSGTRVHLRLRLGPLRRPWLASSVGDWFDLLTIAGMAAGLRERLSGA